MEPDVCNQLKRFESQHLQTHCHVSWRQALYNLLSLVNFVEFCFNSCTATLEPNCNEQGLLLFYNVSPQTDSIAGDGQNLWAP